MSKLVDKKVFILARISLGIFMLYFFCAYIYSFDYIVEASPQISDLKKMLDDSTLFLFLTAIKFLIALGVITSILMILGILVRLSGLLIWIGLLAAINANELIMQLHYPFISLILISIIIFYDQNFFNCEINFKACRMHEGPWRETLAKLVYFVIFISGISKCFSYEWREGLITKLLCNQIIFAQTASVYCASSYLTFKLLTYTVLCIEIGSVLFLFKKFRFIVWTLNVILQIGIFAFIPVQNISLAMLMLHLFLFHTALFKEDLIFKRFF